jgi:hypothetical protein
MNQGGGVWTRDLGTFLVGLGAAVAVTVGLELVQLEGARKVPDWYTWLISLLTAALSASGRYLLTYLAQRGFKGMWTRVKR